MTRAALIPLLLLGCTRLTETHSDPNGRFSVGVPAFWSVDLERGQSVFSRAGEPDVTVTLGTALRKENPRRAERTLAIAVDAARTQLSLLPGAELLAERATAIEGQPAHRLEVRFDHHGRIYQRTQLVVQGPHDIGYLAVTSPEARHEPAVAIGEAMAASLKFSERGTP